MKLILSLAIFMASLLVVSTAGAVTYCPGPAGCVCPPNDPCGQEPVNSQYLYHVCCVESEGCYSVADLNAAVCPGDFMFGASNSPEANRWRAIFYLTSNSPDTPDVSLYDVNQISGDPMFGLCLSYNGGNPWLCLQLVASSGTALNSSVALDVLAGGSEFPMIATDGNSVYGYYQSCYYPPLNCTPNPPYGGGCDTMPNTDGSCCYAASDGVSSSGFALDPAYAGLTAPDGSSAYLANVYNGFPIPPENGYLDNGTTLFICQ